MKLNLKFWTWWRSPRTLGSWEDSLPTIDQSTTPMPPTKPPLNQLPIKVYFICPVANCSDETRAEMDAYVKGLETCGRVVHYPPRDVELNAGNSNRGMDEMTAICRQHLYAMRDADEVHTWWDSNSKGSHFDFGMAYMYNLLNEEKAKKFVLANKPDLSKDRGYGKFYKGLQDSNRAI